MTQYETNLLAALTSQISHRSNRISALEMFKQGYRALGRYKDAREVDESLWVLRNEQCIAKRTVGHLTSYRRYTKYLEEVIDEIYPIRNNNAIRQYPSNNLG